MLLNLNVTLALWNDEQQLELTKERLSQNIYIIQYQLTVFLGNTHGLKLTNLQLTNLKCKIVKLNLPKKGMHVTPRKQQAAIFETKLDLPGAHYLQTVEF